MPIVYTYPTVTPTNADLLLLSDVSDPQKRTKSALVSDIVALASGGGSPDLQDIYDEGTDPANVPAGFSTSDVFGELPDGRVISQSVGDITGTDYANVTIGDAPGGAQPGNVAFYAMTTAGGGVDFGKLIMRSSNTTGDSGIRLHSGEIGFDIDGSTPLAGKVLTCKNVASSYGQVEWADLDWQTVMNSGSTATGLTSNVTLTTSNPIKITGPGGNYLEMDNTPDVKLSTTNNIEIDANAYIINTCAFYSLEPTDEYNLLVTAPAGVISLHCSNGDIKIKSGTSTPAAGKAIYATDSAGTIAYQPGIQTTKVSLSNAEIQALNVTPIELIAAPGAGKAIQLLSVYGFLDYTAPAFNMVDLQVRSAGSSDWLFQLQNSTFVGVAADARRDGLQGMSGEWDENTKIEAHTNGATGAGGSTIDVYLTYIIIDT